ncbi:Uma2 family endonuclease [Thermostichus sp. MS-CIW-30]|jgi:Uma2 family endonuclease
MTTALAPRKTHTSEEYFALEAESEATGGIRREFRNGEIIEITGGTPIHSQLITSVNALLWLKLRGKGFPFFLVISDFTYLPSNNMSIPMVW